MRPVDILHLESVVRIAEDKDSLRTAEWFNVYYNITTLPS